MYIGKRIKAEGEEVFKRFCAKKNEQNAAASTLLQQRTYSTLKGLENKTRWRSYVGRIVRVKTYNFEKIEMPKKRGLFRINAHKREIFK